MKKKRNQRETERKREERGRKKKVIYEKIKKDF